MPDLPLFKSEAERALRIFKRLRIPDVIGQPTLAEACGPWFFDIVAAMFGSYDPVTHKRMIQEYFLMIPKKNSKSSNGGPLMITAAIMNRRPEAEFMFIAPTMEVANIAFRQAAGTVKLDSELDKLFQIQQHVRTITHRRNGTSLKIKAADTDVITGGKQAGAMIDETHVFAKKPKAADVFVELRGALAARPDGFLFQVTTQSKEPPAGVFRSELAKARDVRDGKLRLPLLPVLYEPPEELLEDHRWKERKYWPVLNPNLGRSVSADFLEQQLMIAEREGPEKMVLIASQHFNVEIGLRLRGDGWRGAEYWEAAADPDLADLANLIERSEVIVAGGDGGGLDDLLGLGVIGRETETKRWLAWGHAWAHESVLELRKSEAPVLLDFQAADELTIVETLPDDIEEFADIIRMLDDSGKLAKVGLDPWGVGSLVDALTERGIGGERDTAGDKDRVVAVSQGYKMNGAIKTAERKLSDGSLIHGGQALMAWAVGNAKVEQKGNAVVITKQASGSGKIDPLMALLDAVALMSMNPEAKDGVTIPADYRVVAA